MTLPDLTPEDPETGTRRDHVVERALLGLTVLLAAALALPSLFTALREGSVELATVFYPVMLGAIAVLAWTRRAGQ